MAKTVGKANNSPLIWEGLCYFYLFLVFSGGWLKDIFWHILKMWKTHFNTPPAWPGAESKHLAPPGLTRKQQLSSAVAPWMMLSLERDWSGEFLWKRSSHVVMQKRSSVNGGYGGCKKLGLIFYLSNDIHNFENCRSSVTCPLVYPPEDLFNDFFVSSTDALKLQEGVWSIFAWWCDFLFFEAKIIGILPTHSRYWSCFGSRVLSDFTYLLHTLVWNLWFWEACVKDCHSFCLIWICIQDLHWRD